MVPLMPEPVIETTLQGYADRQSGGGYVHVASGKRYNQWCCFDYGNAETNNIDDGSATMDCIFYGNSTQWGHGSGSGPWIMDDMENGMSAGAAQVDNTNTSIVPTDYVSLMLKGGGYTSTVRELVLHEGR